MPRINARSLRCIVVLNADEMAGPPEPYTPRVTLNIAVTDFGTVSADIAAKSVRRVQNAISEHGVDVVAVIIQRKLVSGNRIAEAGLVAQVRAPRPVAAEVAS